MRQLELDLHVLDDLAWWIQQDRKTALRIIKMIQEKLSGSRSKE